MWFCLVSSGLLRLVTHTTTHTKVSDINLAVHTLLFEPEAGLQQNSYDSTKHIGVGLFQSQMQQVISIFFI